MQNLPISQQSIYSLTLLVQQFLGFNKTTKSEDKKLLRQVEDKLKIFSKSVNYFQLAYEYIINKNGSTNEELFIVSLLMRDKFRYEFDKYSDEESISYLENIVKEIIKKYDNNPPETFSSNICVCMICLYMKRAELLKQKYKQTGILEYFKSFVSDNKGSDYFYKALQYAPEQIYSSKIVMDEIMRERVKMLIKYGQYSVLKHLNSVAEHLWQNKIIKKNHLFACLQNWINMGYKEALFQQLPNHYLVKKLFDYSLDTNFSKETNDCIKVIIKRMKSIKKNQALFTFLGTGVFKLIESIKLHIKQYGAGGQVNQALQIVADFGTLASDFFIENYNSDVKNFLQSTIQFIKLSDIDVYPNLIDFWQTFVNNVHRSEKLKQNPQYLELFKKLYSAICYKTSWSMQMIQKLNQLSEENLGKFHDEAQNVLDRREETESLFEILSVAFGKQQYVKFALGCISLLPKDQPHVFWPNLQSYLNSLRHGIRQILEVSENIQILVTLYNEVNNPYCAIKNVFMSLFKSLMTVQQHNEQLKSQFIIHLFKIIAQNLNNPKVQQKAQKAFSKGCQKNPSIVINYIEDFINLLKEHQGNQEIVRGVMHVLSSNFQALQHYLPKVLTVLFQVFTSTESNLKRKNIYHSYYSVFKILMTYKNKDHFRQTIQQFTQTMWPFLVNNLSAPKDIIDDEDPEVQRAVKLIKFIMRCLRESFEPFLQSLFSTIHEAYQKYPICSYIYMLEVSVTVFYEQAHLNDFFRAAYKNFCQTTYNHLKTKENISSYQLLIDDFIGMNKRFFIYNSSIVLQSGQLPYLIETCINLSNVVDIPQVSKSAYQFFQTIFMVYWSDDFINRHNQAIQGGDKFQKNPQNQSLYKQLKQFIVPKLPQIIMKMINHLQSVPLQSTTQCILDCLLSQIKGFWQINREIWLPILNAIPQQIMTITQKNQIYENLPRVGDYELQICRDSVSRIDRLIYVMNKRFVNNLKRRL